MNIFEFLDEYTGQSYSDLEETPGAGFTEIQTYTNDTEGTTDTEAKEMSVISLGTVEVE